MMSTFANSLVRSMRSVAPRLHRNHSTFLGMPCRSVNKTITSTASDSFDHRSHDRPVRPKIDLKDDQLDQEKERLDKMSQSVKILLQCMGEDTERSGIQRTPERYAKALLFLTKGYHVKFNDFVNNALFDEGHGEMVIVKDIELHSLCEHHLLPFTGKVSPFDTQDCFSRV